MYSFRKGLKEYLGVGDLKVSLNPFYDVNKITTDVVIVHDMLCA